MLEGEIYLAVGAGAGDVVAFSAGAGGLRHFDWDLDWVGCGGCFGLGVEKVGDLGVRLVGERLGSKKECLGGWDGPSYVGRPTCLATYD